MNWRLGKKNARRARSHSALVIAQRKMGVPPKADLTTGFDKGPGGSGDCVGADPEPAPPVRGTADCGDLYETAPGDASTENCLRLSCSVFRT